MKNVFVIALALVGFSIALSACNTVQGIGKDIQKGGNAISHAAKNDS